MSDGERQVTQTRVPAGSDNKATSNCIAAKRISSTLSLLSSSAKVIMSGMAESTRLGIEWPTKWLGVSMSNCHQLQRLTMLLIQFCKEFDGNRASE